MHATLAQTHTTKGNPHADVETDPGEAQETSDTNRIADRAARAGRARRHPRVNGTAWAHHGGYRCTSQARPACGRQAERRVSRARRTPREHEKSREKGKLPAKYRNPKTGGTWSGWARPPAWIANVKDRSKFLIDAEGAESSATPKKTAARKVAAKRWALPPTLQPTWSISFFQAHHAANDKRPPMRRAPAVCRHGGSHV